jgi:RNA polymerase sigma factor (sigma-70 family)
MKELLLTQILAGCREGAPDACRELVRRFEAHAQGLARALVGDAHLAEDAVQNAFVRALGSLGDLRDDRAFAGWFRQIVRSECHRITRRGGHEALPEEVASDRVAPDDVMALAEKRALVREALALLPRAGRETAELFYLEGKTCMEVAQALGVPEGTVKRRLHDARARLGEMLLGLHEEDKQRQSGKPERDLPAL